VALVVLLSLAMGIGVNSAMFSVVDALYLRPLPVKNPEQLVRIDSRDRGGHFDRDSYADYLDIRSQSTAFSDVIAQNRQGALLAVNGETELVSLTVVSDNYFSVLGVNAHAGRIFSPVLDQHLDREPAAIISYGLWQRRFGGKRDLVGKSIVLMDRNYTVVGIAPPSFRGLVVGIGVASDVWLPASAWVVLANGNRTAIEKRDIRKFDLVGRMRPGVRVEQAQAQLDTITGGLAQAYPATNAGRRTSARLLSQSGNRVFSILLMSVAALILLTACVNVATLLLAQMEARRREMGVRLALGAGGGRLTRQLLTESVVLSLTGAVAGLLLALWFIQSVPALMPPGAMRLDLGMRLDGRVLGFTVLLSIVTALIFGTVPARRASQTELASVLKGEEAQTGRGWRRISVRNALVAGQIALSVILVTVAGLLLRSLQYSQRISPGFDPNKKMLTMIVAPGRAVRGPEQLLMFCDELADRVRSLPGVRHASYARRMPLSGSGGGATVEMSIPGVEFSDGQKVLSTPYNQVAANYFATVGARILSGRGFDRSDTPGSAKVALINETMAHRFWPGGDPVGKIVQIQGGPVQILGVVEEGKNSQLHEEPQPLLYFPFAQRMTGEFTLLIETTGEPGPLTALVKRELRQVDPNLHFLMVATLRDLMAQSLWADRALAAIASGVAFLGMFLASMGLYSVLAYFVNQRRREIGVRMAVGAQRHNILQSVLGHGLRLAMVGVPLGLGVAYACGLLMAGALYGVSPTDPLTFLASSAVVFGVVLLASAVPAWRAARVDPVITLRYE
jgi:predicted permease